MNTNPKVSIIVPSYKMEKYLFQCINSLINQKLKNIEIIVVDEGDDDESKRIVELLKEKDSRIKYLHKFHGGYGTSLNDGIKNAKGEYIGIVEADDFACKNMFFDLYNLAVKNNADIVKSDFYYYTTSNNSSRKAGKISKFLTNKIVNIYTNPEIIKIQPSIWSAIYKKDFLVKNNISFLETKGGSYQDTSFSFKTLSCADKIIFTTKAYLYYRIDNELSSVNSKEKVFAINDEFEEITNFLNKNPKIKQQINTQKLIKQYSAYIWNLKRIDKKYRKDFIERFSLEFSIYLQNKEITKDFYKKINENDFKLLLLEKEKFEKRIEILTNKHKKREKINKNFSIRINTSRISVVLFGKQILAKEF